MIEFICNDKYMCYNIKPYIGGCLSIMKYRSISLNGNEYGRLALVKYEEKYKSQLDELRNMNPNLATKVEQCPKTYGEIDECQSYMIFQDYNDCIGAISIAPYNDDKDLELVVQLNEKKISSPNEMLGVIKQIITSLKLLFFDKENLEIRVINNDIDLSQINHYDYQKRVHDDNSISYKCLNKRTNSIISQLIEEIVGTHKTLIDWGQSWWEKITGASNIRDVFDKELIDEINKRIATIPEIFSKFENIIWSGIESKKSSRNITFSRNGYIEFSKKSRNDKNGIDYNISYNILSDGFNLKSISRRNKQAESLEIDENPYYTNIKTGNTNYMHLKDKKIKKIDYISPIIDNSSIYIELWTNDQNEITKCNVDFRTHKDNGKINGFYALRINPQQYYDKISIRFISRKGTRERDFSDKIENLEELFSTTIDGQATATAIDELIMKVIIIINNRASDNKRQSISSMNDGIISSIMNTEKEVINFVKQIKGEIPLPHLQANLEKFVNEHDKNKKTGKKRVKK